MPTVLRIVIDTVTSGSAAKGKIIRSIGGSLILPTAMTRAERLGAVPNTTRSLRLWAPNSRFGVEAR